MLEIIVQKITIHYLLLQFNEKKHNKKQFLCQIRYSLNTPYRSNQVM
jgi:hypothetical protein